MLQGAPNRGVFFHASQNESGRDAKALKALLHDVLEELPGALAAGRIGIQHSNHRISHRPGLHHWASLAEDRADGVQLVSSDCERRALHRGDALPGRSETKIKPARDPYARGAIDWLQP